MISLLFEAHQTLEDPVNPTEQTREKTLRPMSGTGLLAALIVLELAAVGTFVVDVIRSGQPSELFLAIMILSLLALPFILPGFFVVPPKMAAVLVLLGKYSGTVRESGFFWANPFARRQLISLKATNMASNKIKVNDLDGNPIEIGAVVVFQVQNTAQALFDVEDYMHYVDVQIETAVRRLASTHPYDDTEDADLISLRGDSEDVANELQAQLQERLDRAGIRVIESRISHLAYAAEIAASMLQRQQATAVIAARRKIVEGAVGMVEDALGQLREKNVVELDGERRATLVGNLLVVLCGQADAQPVINTGTLYN
jgi:regulator of protease activity HflC (stomatin/prohibitin superfamily)